MKCYPEQEKLLKAVIESDCFQANEMPTVPDEMRKPPKTRAINGDLFESSNRELGKLRGQMTIYGDSVHTDFEDEWEMDS